MKHVLRRPPARNAIRILAIDDDRATLNNYERLFARAGHQCLALSDLGEALARMPEFRPDVIVTDGITPQRSGLDVLSRIQAADPNIPVILVSNDNSVDHAVAAMKKHAADYIIKPFSVAELIARIEEACQVIPRERNLAPAVRDEAVGDSGGLGIVGISSALTNVLQLTQRVARTDVNVLIVGQSGTGKEVFARAIHRLSTRNSEIFVPVDCASLPEHLLESELFGYRKGAFTGANSDKMGLFEFAHKGTLFLDEIGEMPLALQSKMLRVLQERRFRPIGGRHEIEIDVRVVAATNRDPQSAMNEKLLRSDLYYRISAATLHLPSLRERTEDIPLLAKHFLKSFADDNRLSCTGIAKSALDALRQYDWPGNVRELQNVIEYAATMARGSNLEKVDLPANLRGPGDTLTVEDDCPHPLFTAKDSLVEQFERDFLVPLLIEHRFNVSRAAMAAGCHRRTLYRMIHRRGLDLDLLKQERRHLHDDSGAQKPVAIGS